MDYLNILSTRSLILFPDAVAIVAPTKPIHNRTYSSSSSNTTPTGSTLLLPPTPISMPLTSLIYGDTNTAYFLIQHVLSSSGVASPSIEDQQEVVGFGLGYGYGFGGLNVGKDVMADAEVIVWREMDKAKMFIRDLGASFGAGHSVKDEKFLRELAGKYGLALKEDQPHDHDHEHEHDNAHDTLVEEVDQLNLSSHGSSTIMA